MKRVWKCGFCSQTNDIEEEMIKHEEECSFNPANKKCASCKHHEYGPHTISGHMEECLAGIDSQTMWVIQEDDLPCGQWAGE